MKKVIIVNQKGGVGKTMTAINLAVAAVHAGHSVVLVDLNDPQNSATKWGQTRSQDSTLSEDSLIVVPAHVSRLKEVLTTAEAGGVDLAIVDTAPNSDPDLYKEVKKSNLCDLAVIPCSDDRFDLEAIGATIELGEMAGMRMRILFNAIRARSAMLYKAKQAVKVYEVPTAPCIIHERVAIKYAVIDGKGVQEFEPEGKAANEVRSLYRYIQRELEV